MIGGDIIGGLIALGLAAVGGAALGLVVALVLRGLARRASPATATSVRRELMRPIVLLGAALAARAAAPLVDASQPLLQVVLHALLLVLIASVGWGVVAATAVGEAALAERFALDTDDNLTARKVHTRFQVLRRITVVVVLALTGAAMLVTFPGMRHLGAGILASAGIAGIVLGIAARPTVENLLAGLQLALTHPINIDDVVIIEGEWGRIEEITTTYVVVRIWDKRRLIVPIGRFIHQPFQNWTRVTADLLGAVTVEVDYRTPVEAVRAAVGEMLAGCDLWDGEFWNLQVVEAGERTLRLRVLVSAPNADNAWALRCHVREWIVTWLQREHPDALPRLRAEVAPRPTFTPEAVGPP